jgi:hypothetical protein
MPTVPTAPGAFIIVSYTNNRVSGDADPHSTGGATILQWQLGWGESPNTPEFVGDLAANGNGVVTGLTPGHNTYFWNRQRNAYGWSDFSPRTMVRMRDRPDPPSKPQAIMRTQTTANIIMAPSWTGDSPITSYTLWISNSPNVVDQSFTQSSPSFHLTGLKPGYNYYLWGQATNIYGTSDLSPRGEMLLVAGARVNVGGTWKRAIPYVKHNGVWKMARSWEKVNGVWKQLPD